MAELRHIATLSGANTSFVTNVTDLDIEWIDDQPRLFVATRLGGGVTVFAVSGSAGAAGLMQHTGYGGGLSALDTPDALTVAGPTGSYLVPLGLRNGASTSYVLGSSSTLGATQNLGGTGALASDLTSAVSVTIGGHVYIYGARAGRSGPVVYELGAGGSITQLSAGAPPLGAAIDAMAVATVAGQSVLLAVSTEGNTITAYRIGADGLPQLASTIAASSGIGFSQPTVLTTVSAYGETFVIMGAAESGSLTVFRLAADGALVAVDHITDTLFSRFDGVTAVEAVTVGDRVFVIAGGADDGLSVFTLLPDGRLLHLTSIADSAETTLNDITALAAVYAGGRIQIFASGEGEVGISQFELDLGLPGATVLGGAGAMGGTSGDDLMVAGAATTLMNGGGGDDILVTAAGDVELWGRSGRDRFVISDGARNVTIMDYQNGTDIIDLTGLPFLRGMAQVTFTSITGGAVLRYGNTTITVLTANGSTLLPSQFTGAGSVEITRFPPGYVYVPGAPDPVENQMFGTETRDVLIGSGENNLIEGYGGADRLDGGDGDDTLDGGTGADLLIGGAGNDLLAGGDGADLLDGGAGNDTLSAGAGTDLLLGGAGADALQGGDDADRLYGGAGADALAGDAGDDWLDGGAADDRLSGGTGTDVLLGGAGADTLTGGAGYDLLTGGPGADHFVFAPCDSGSAGLAPDLITDFTPGEDLIDLSGLGLAEFIGAAGFGGVAGQVRYEMTGGAGVVSIDLDGDALADLMIHLTGCPTLGATDFLF